MNMNVPHYPGIIKDNLMIVITKKKKKVVNLQIQFKVKNTNLIAHEKGQIGWVKKRKNERIYKLNMKSKNKMNSKMEKIMKMK